MPTVKYKELKEIGKDERTKKLSELNLELVKAKSQSAKGGSARIKEIKKIIARIYTLDTRNILKEDKKDDLKNKMLNKTRTKDKGKVEKKT